MRLRLTHRGLGVLAALLLVVVSPRLAGAHANYEKSDPPANAFVEKAPGQVTVLFTEPAEPRFSELQVFDTNRRRVDLDDLAPLSGDPRSLTIGLGDLPPGTYTVMWKTLSAVDGHTARGGFPFTVGLDQVPTGMVLPTGAEGAGFSPWSVVSRWLNLLTAVIVVGAFLFLPGILGRALRAVAGGAGDAAGVAAAWEVGRRRGLRVAAWAAGAGLVAGVLALLVQAAIAADVQPWETLGGPVSILLGTRYGLIWIGRMLLLVVLGALAVYLQRPGTTARHRGWLLGGALGAALLFTSSLNSHAAAAQQWAEVAVVVDWAHLAATAIWVGGLAQLALTLPATLAALQPGPRGRLLAATIPRFSAWAMMSVGALVISGLYATWLQVGSWDALTATTYGQTLLVKVALLLPLLVLGALNLLVLSPRVAGAASRGTRATLDRLGRLQRGLRQSVGVELLLGVLILAVVGLLTSLEPARDAVRAIGLTRSVDVEGLQGVLRVTPAEAGLNTFDLTLADNGQPLSDAQRVTLRFTHREMDMGTIDQRLEPTGDGHYRSLSGALSMSGSWNTVVIVRRVGMDDVRGETQFAAADPNARQGPNSLVAAGALPPTRLVVGSVVLALGVLFLVEAVRPARRRRGKTATVALGCVAVVFGLLLSSLAALYPTGGDAVIPNPVPVTASSINRGQELYQQNCVMCHGLNGRGDGPLAPTLNPRPADLRVHVSQHTEGQLWLWLSDGVPGSAIPAYRATMSDEDRWNVINYLEDRFGANPSASTNSRVQP